MVKRNDARAAVSCHRTVLINNFVFNFLVGLLIVFNFQIIVVIFLCILSWKMLTH